MSSSIHPTVSDSQLNRTLVIMAKAPKPGTVKTRLIENLPLPAVTALYRSLLDDTLALAASLTNVDVAIMCPESDQADLAEFVGTRARIVPQTGNGLAAGLTSVFRYFAAYGARVIAFNSDSPHLAPSVLQQAFEILAQYDVVIGPTHDGGYYLVGAKESYPSLFEHDGMGTASALDRLLARTKALGLSTGFSDTFYDVDVKSDLLQLARELQVEPRKAPRTAAWFREWQQAVAQLQAGRP
jgi:uncharacterized protein